MFIKRHTETAESFNNFPAIRLLKRFGRKRAINPPKKPQRTSLISYTILGIFCAIIFSTRVLSQEVVGIERRNNQIWVHSLIASTSELRLTALGIVSAKKNAAYTV